MYTVIYLFIQGTTSYHYSIHIFYFKLKEKNYISLIRGK